MCTGDVGSVDAAALGCSFCVLVDVVLIWLVGSELFLWGLVVAMKNLFGPLLWPPRRCVHGRVCRFLGRVVDVVGIDGGGAGGDCGGGGAARVEPEVK